MDTIPRGLPGRHGVLQPIGISTRSGEHLPAAFVEQPRGPVTGRWSWGELEVKWPPAPTASEPSSRTREHLQAEALEMLAQGRSATPSRRHGGDEAGHRRPGAGAGGGGQGREPERPPETGPALRMLASLDAEVCRTWLVRRYYTRQGHLQGDCFYAGLCEPIEETERRIRETAAYIDDAERLAAV